VLPFGRRNLSAYDRSVLALKLKPIIEAEAKKNQGTRNDLTPVRNLTEVATDEKQGCQKSDNLKDNSQQNANTVCQKSDKRPIDT